jgi:UDP-N-acetylmuramate: L-alanyl-gamma-D-glutamyl-meso-diaminopimelate ligase
LGASAHSLIEGDEYDTAFFDKGPKFLHYMPDLVVLNNIEYDHADIYADLEACQEVLPAVDQHDSVTGPPARGMGFRGGA